MEFGGSAESRGAGAAGTGGNRGKHVYDGFRADVLECIAVEESVAAFAPGEGVR
ncbi:hypothetical protein D3C86_2083860 [compost metagenome]